MKKNADSGRSEGTSQQPAKMCRLLANFMYKRKNIARYCERRSGGGYGAEHGY